MVTSSDSMSAESFWAKRGTTRWTLRCARLTRITAQSLNGDFVRMVPIRWNTSGGDPRPDRSPQELTISLEAIRHPSRVRRTTCRTRAAPSTASLLHTLARRRWARAASGLDAGPCDRLLPEQPSDSYRPVCTGRLRRRRHAHQLVALLVDDRGRLPAVDHHGGLSGLPG